MHLKLLAPSTPEDFVDILYARASVWREMPGAWIFRGQGDASWPLLPGAFRPTAKLVDLETGKMLRNRNVTVLRQARAELHTLHMFLGRADAGGLPFAKEEDSLLSAGAYLDKWGPYFERLKDDPTGWPSDDVLQNLALAQHYGISTRLLDWSTSALVAGYFASRSAAERWHHAGRDTTAPAGEFCVWALRSEFFDWAAASKLGFGSVVRVPRAPNPNLHAQSGLFVKYTPHAVPPKPDEPFSPLTFDERTADVYRLLASRHPNEIDAISPVLIKITAPLRYAPVALRLMAEIGMSAAAIYPGYDGAADAVAERAFWDNG